MSTVLAFDIFFLIYVHKFEYYNGSVYINNNDLCFQVTQSSNSLQPHILSADFFLNNSESVIKDRLMYILSQFTKLIDTDY